MSAIQCDSANKVNCRALRYRGYTLEHIFAVFIGEAIEPDILSVLLLLSSPDHMRNPCYRQLRNRLSANEKQGNEP